MNYCNYCNESLSFSIKRPGITTKKIIKYLVVMKVILLIMAFNLQVSAAVFGQQVTIRCSNAQLREIMRSVQKQTGYNFLFETNYLKDAKPVTLNLSQTPIDKALQTIFADQPFTYNVDGKMITLTLKEHSIIDKVKSFFSTISIRGKVTDEEGNPLPGSSVKAGGKATITNSNGEFSLDGVDENVIVEISYVGFKPNKIKASSDFLSIRLERNTADLNEVIINKGYYSTTKTDNTGSVSTVLAKDLTKNPVGDPLTALIGSVPGLFISQNSGIPGAEVNVKLRGQNSLANGNNPLYIVDGIPFPSVSLTAGTILGGSAGNLSPFSNIRLDDIERVEVLKDADATAIYGSRGANGVILITTKKGIAGKTKVNVGVYSGAGTAGRKMKLMNTEEYLQMRNQALANDGTSAGDFDYDLNSQWGDIHKYTDWQKEMIGGTAHITDATASVSGGTQLTQFTFGSGYRREGTVFPGDFRDQKASAHISISHQNENKRFKSNVSVSYVNDNNRLPQVDFTTNILQAPNTPDIFTADGKYNFQNSTWENPVWYTTQYVNAVSDNLNAAMNLSYGILKGLEISSRMGYNDIKMNSYVPTTFAGYNPDIPIDPSYRSNSFGNNRVKTWIIEPGITYAREIGKGKLESLVGATLQQNDQTGIYQLATGFASDALVNNIASAATIGTNTFTDTRYRYSALYARLGYNYNSNFLINLTGRRDASSRFGPGKQLANFGAIGAAWIISHMDWFKPILSAVSFAKLRASYGLTGNDQLPDYKFLSTSGSLGSNYQGIPGLKPTSLTNPFYGWETVKKLEAGLEIGLLKDKIFLTTSYFRNRTGNQLVGYSLPDITGFPSIQANLPAVIENKGAEIEITANAVDSKDFRWTISGNLTIPKNKLVEYPNLAGSTYVTQYVIGQPLSISFLYRYKGIDPTSKVYTVEDLDKDGAIVRLKDTKPVFVGQKFFGGLNNSFFYKGLQLDLFLQFVKQTGFNQTSLSAPGIFYADGPNQRRAILDQVNAGKLQAFTSSYGTLGDKAYGLYTNSDYSVGDASFIRLKNVSLSWQIPQKLQQVLKLQNARVFIQAQNLFTITRYDGLDPEVASSKVRGGALLKLPPLRIITAGIQIGL
jgi:TonB-linked SusC/RagA family outer membrane protein